jgi:hypothetical protein
MVSPAVRPSTLRAFERTATESVQLTEPTLAARARELNERDQFVMYDERPRADSDEKHKKKKKKKKS